ncbi:MAG TPA: hypothetical protein VHU84_15365 [Lacipirellulaceae bacterium]|jgi:hypothetical protein|nr:hypothetical protein [Lacipirellulaceae bacterium]
MIYNFRRFACIALCLSCASVPLAATAQLPSAAKLCDEGVNAYFAGRASQAETCLSEAIRANSHDPRAYYFRAFSLLRQGHVAEARGDMLAGATLEAQSPHREPIGAALERIQGCDRLMLEEFRRNARRNVVAPASATSGLPSAATAPPAQSPLNYAPEMLRERRVVPIDELLRPGGPQSVVENPATNAAPLPAQSTGSEAGQKAEQPNAAKSEKDPFADDSAKPATESTPPPAAAPAMPPQTAPVTPPQATPVTPPQTGPAPAAPTTPPDKKDDNPFGG